jgi:hypothetical protein
VLERAYPRYHSQWRLAIKGPDFRARARSCAEFANYFQQSWPTTGPQAMRLLATSLGPIHGDAFHPALLVLGAIAAVAIGWVIWEFWFRNKMKG